MTMEPDFGRICIVGVGLMGGSLGLACKKRSIAREIIGIGRNRSRLEQARQLGAIDDFELDKKTGLRGADVVVLATPTGVIVEYLRELGNYLEPGVIITDVGSTKAEIVSAAEEVLPEGVMFVGGHPIAGTEKSGVEAASADLYAGAKCILTPTSNTSLQAQQRVAALWSAVGSEVEIMDPQHHDKILAIVSHLPHVVAYALVSTLIKLDDQLGEVLPFTAGGFRDFTRIAASDPVMWRDICLSNRGNIVEMTELFQQALVELRDKITAEDGSGLREGFTQAASVRRKLSQKEVT